MTSTLTIWQNGVPVIPGGDGTFTIWQNGVPVLDMGEVSAPPVTGGGSRIVSPRQPMIHVHSLVSHMRRIGPKSRDRAPI